MAERIDMTGMRFGNLTVIGVAPKPEHTKLTGLFWKCRCDCGNETVVYGASLRSGLTKSCGCLSKEVSHDVHVTHGMKGTRLYSVWQNMKKRCTYKSCRSYKDYGGRGITICDEWTQFEPFMKWALSHGYTDEMTIERIDVNGNYCPENCTWIKGALQARNKTNSHMITFNGETHCLNEWAIISGISRSAIRYRLKAGWSIEDTLTTPQSDRYTKNRKGDLTI